MGICSFKKTKQKNEKHIPIQEPTNTVQQTNQSGSKEIIDYYESVQLSTIMRTKPKNTYIAELINKQQFENDFCEKFVQKIESKSELIVRCYNHFTEKASTIQLKVIEYYKNSYLNYIQSNLDTQTNQQYITNQTIQLLIETTIILNCLMDKNFDEEEELWWGNGYFNERIFNLIGENDFEITDFIVSPIVNYISSLKTKICQVMPSLTVAQPKSLANSIAITNIHLTQFYKDLKLEFAQVAEEQQIK